MPPTLSPHRTLSRESTQLSISLPILALWSRHRTSSLNNVTATFVLLEAAARVGVRRAIIASSMAALGLSWASRFRSPDYVPVDEHHPLRPEESYGLSKQVDEATAEMMARRYEMTVLAYRFCYTTSVDEIEARAIKIASDAGESTRSAKELWAYLDVRDAADAVLAGLERPLSGFHAIEHCGTGDVGVGPDCGAPATLAPDCRGKGHPGRQTEPLRHRQGCRAARLQRQTPPPADR